MFDVLTCYLQVVIGEFHSQEIFFELIRGSPWEHPESRQVNDLRFQQYLHRVAFCSQVGRYNNRLRRETDTGKNQSILFVRYKGEIAIIIGNKYLVMESRVGNGYVRDNGFGAVGIMNNTAKLNQIFFFLLGEGSCSHK